MRWFNTLSFEVKNSIFLEFNRRKTNWSYYQILDELVFTAKILTLKNLLIISENDEDGGLLMTCWSCPFGCSKCSPVMSGGGTCTSSACRPTPASPAPNPRCCWLIITFTSLRWWPFRRGVVSEVKGKQGDPGGWRLVWVEWRHSTGATCLEPPWSELSNGTDEDRWLVWDLPMGQALR